MKYVFAYKALGSSPSEDNFDRHIRCGVGADEAVEKEGYSGMTLGLMLLGGLLVGGAIGYFYRDTELQAPAFAPPPAYRPSTYRLTKVDRGYGAALADEGPNQRRLMPDDDSWMTPEYRAERDARLRSRGL